MNEKVCTLCGRTGHRAASCPATGRIGTGAWFVKSADGMLSEARPGLTPGLTILAKSAPYLGLGLITSTSSTKATEVNGVTGDE